MPLVWWLSFLDGGLLRASFRQLASWSWAPLSCVSWRDFLSFSLLKQGWWVKPSWLLLCFRSLEKPLSFSCTVMFLIASLTGPPLGILFVHLTVWLWDTQGRYFFHFSVENFNYIFLFDLLSSSFPRFWFVIYPFVDFLIHILHYLLNFI